MSMRGLCVDSLMFVDTERYLKFTSKGHRWATDADDGNHILWSDVIDEIWNSSLNNIMHSGNSEVISFDGFFGSCFDCHLNQNTMKFHEKRMLRTLRNKVNITQLMADDEWTVF